MDLGIMWIFVGAIVVVFALALVSSARGKREAARYRGEYEQSLKTQAAAVELLREVASSQREANERLDAIQKSLKTLEGARTNGSPRA
jgi:Flp pilus assembly protein TadB